MTRKEQAARSRAALVEAARACFTEVGYDDTTVAAILQRAGMARGALYHYFPDGKAEIFAAVFDLLNEEFHRRRDALLELPSPLQRLRAGIGVFLELCTNGDFARIVLTDAPRVVPGQNGRGSSYRLLREQVAGAVAAAEMVPVDIDATSIALYGAARSAGEHIIAARDQAQAVRQAQDVLGRFLDGLRAGQP